MLKINENYHFFLFVVRSFFLFFYFPTQLPLLYKYIGILAKIPIATANFAWLMAHPPYKAAFKAH